MVRSTSDAIKETKSLDWSDFQKKIFEFVRYGRGHGFVQARAGSGKTTVTLEALKHTPKNSKVLFMAFNKSIAEELRHRAPQHVDVKTYHSFGFWALRNKFGQMDVNHDKVDFILREIVPDKLFFQMAPSLRKLVSLAKSYVAKTADDIFALAMYHGTLIYNPLDFMSNIHEFVIPALELCKQRANVVDFDDMCWLPTVLNLPTPKYDFVAVDEAQDTAVGQAYLAEAALRPNGRIMGVGDSLQSVYSFRGASVDAVDKFVKRFKAKVFPMPITYRCPKAVVRLAQELVPDLQAAPNAEEGEVNYYSFTNMLEDIVPGDMVLCRTMAPLVDPCFKLIQLGYKAYLRGSDIGMSLVSLIKKLDAGSIDNLFDKLEEYKQDKIEEFVKMGKPDLAQKAVDNVDAIDAFSHGCRTVDELIKRITSMFSDEIKGVVFSTVHRAKGLEADNVWILRPDLMPHPAARLEWEHQQETNLKYVAYTRAKKILNIVNSGYPSHRRRAVKRLAPNEHIMNKAHSAKKLAQSVTTQSDSELPVPLRRNDI